MFVSVYVCVCFMHACFVPLLFTNDVQIPFSLCLRVWDIYLLDGEKVVTAMAYNILRMHKQYILKLRDMDQIVQYIQVNYSFDNALLIFFVIHPDRYYRMAF